MHRRFAGRIFVAGALFFAPGPSLRAGAWLPAQGQGEAILATSFSQATQNFDSYGHFVPTPRYRSAEADLFVIYGVTDWLSVIARPSLQASSLGPPQSQSSFGAGDSELAAQIKLWRDDATAVSALVGLRIPTSGGSTANALRGPDRAEYDFRMMAGRSFVWLGFPGFVDLAAGVRLVPPPQPNENHFDATLGVYVAPRLLVLAQTFVTQSAPALSPRYPQWSQAKAQVSLVERFGADWRIQLGYYWTYAGKNAWRESGVVLGLWRRF